MKTLAMISIGILLSGCAINPVTSLGDKGEVWVADKHDTAIISWTNILYCQANKSADGKSSQPVCTEARKVK